MKIVKFKIQNLILGCGKQLDDNRAMMYRCGGNSKFRYDNLKSAY